MPGGLDDLRRAIRQSTAARLTCVARPKKEGPVNHMPVKHTHIGGQAVLEGVMMRGKHNWAIAVRGPDGSIHTEQHELPSGGERSAWRTWPVLRGVVALFDTIVLALQAFSISARYAGADEASGEEMSGGQIGLAMVIGLVVALGLFIVLPAVATNLLGGAVSKTPILWNVIDGVLRIAVFVAYIWIVSRVRDVQRLFAYHGAEHKTIHAFEHEEPLRPASIQTFDTMHVRCGTSFLLMVMVVAILVFSVVPTQSLVARILVRIVLFPLIAGLAYEVIRFAGSHSDNPVVKVLLWPGLMMQKLTTREPDDSMVEVAVMALRPVLEREESAEELADGDWVAPEYREQPSVGPADDLADHQAGAAAPVPGMAVADA